MVETIASGIATEKDVTASPHAIRRLLFLHWASFRNAFKLQPLQLIQDYFGVQAWRMGSFIYNYLLRIQNGQ